MPLRPLIFPLGGSRNALSLPWIAMSCRRLVRAWPTGTLTLPEEPRRIQVESIETVTSMISNFRWPKPESPPDEKLISNVQEYGCHIIRVFASESGPGFAYSIGMYLNYGQPEVIVFGISAEHAHVILNDICKHAARGERFVAGDRTDQFLQGFDVCFTEVPLEVYPEYL